MSAFGGGGSARTHPRCPSRPLAVRHCYGSGPAGGLELDMWNTLLPRIDNSADVQSLVIFSMSYLIEPELETCITLFVLTLCLIYI